MAISGILSGSNQSWSWMAALAVLMSIPVVLIFILLQKAILERMSFGGIE
jgi:ABC-type maltose transport system permease subunit